MTESLLSSAWTTTIREKIENERKRIFLASEDVDWWVIRRKDSEWAREIFGGTLKERTAEEIYSSITDKSLKHLGPTYEISCDICDKKFGLDEKIIRVHITDGLEVGFDMWLSLHEECLKLRDKIYNKSEDND